MYTEPDSWTWMPLGSFLRGLGIYHPLRYADRLDGALPHPLDDFGSQKPCFRPGTSFRESCVGNRSLGHPSLHSAFADLQEFGHVALRKNVTAAHWQSLAAVALPSRELSLLCDSAIRDRV